MLDALIELAGMSYAGLAARVCKAGKARGLNLRYDHASVRRWVRDHAVPRGIVPELVCEVLSARLGRAVTLADIALADDGERREEGQLRKAVDDAAALWRGDLKKAAVLRGSRQVQGAAAIAPVFEWENPPGDLDVSNEGAAPVDPQCARGLWVARMRYERMYRAVGGIPVRPRVVTYLNQHAIPLLRSSYPDAAGRQLYRDAGSLAALAGICAYDMDLHGLAQRYLFGALRMAKASADRGFGGYVIALLANQAFYLGLYRQVIQYAETALRGAGRALTPALTADLSTLQAKSYARMGDRAGCHASMRRADDMVARILPDEEPPEMGYVQPGLVDVQHAEALRRLGDLSAAHSYACQAIAVVGECHQRGQVHRFATLATVLAEQGDAEAAAAAAGEMLDRAAGMESCRIEERVIADRDAITSRSDGVAARAFAERVSDVLAISA